MKLHSFRVLIVVAGICAFAGLAGAQDLVYQDNGFGQVPIFENQINVDNAVIDTYFGMIGNWWGYGGIQMNDTTSTRVGIFSIWDFNIEESTIYAYNSGLNIAKMGRFGGEGTGVQFLFNYPWEYGTNYRVAYRMFAEADGVHTRFNAFFYDRRLQTWTYVVTHRANTGGQLLNTNWLYSFNENYGGTYGDRNATMNNAWVYRTGTGWADLTSGTASNIPQGPQDFGEILTSTKGFQFRSGPLITPMADNTPVSYTPSASEAPIVIPYYLSCGNVNAEGNWEPDGYWTDTAGDSHRYKDPTTVDTSAIANPAPQAVYQHRRSGSNFQYNLVGFIPGTSYLVTLQFVEPTAIAAGRRLENVTINGTQVLKNFDIFKAAGGKHKAVAESFWTKADSTGQIVVQFTHAPGSPNPSAIINAIAATMRYPGFAVAASPRYFGVTQGSSATSTVTVASLNGFSSATALSVSGLPSGVTAAFSTNPVLQTGSGSATSTLTLTASATAPLGTAAVIVTGTSGALIHTTTIDPTVNTPPPPSPINFVQVNANDATTATPASASSVAIPYTAAQIAGDLNIVVVGWGDTTSTVSSVTDSSGNTYALAVGPTKSTAVPGTQSVYYASNVNAAAAGANTVTVTFNTAAAYPDIRIAEYNGVSRLDAVAAGTGKNSGEMYSGKVTTTAAPELLFAANNVGYWTNSPGHGYTERILTQWGDIVEDKVVSAVGTYYATAIQSPAGWIMQLAAFK